MTFGGRLIIRMDEEKLGAEMYLACWEVWQPGRGLANIWVEAEL